MFLYITLYGVYQKTAFIPYKVGSYPMKRLAITCIYSLYCGSKPNVLWDNGMFLEHLLKQRLNKNAFSTASNFIQRSETWNSPSVTSPTLHQPPIKICYPSVTPRPTALGNNLHRVAKKMSHKHVSLVKKSLIFGYNTRQTTFGEL